MGIEALRDDPIPKAAKETGTAPLVIFCEIVHGGLYEQAGGLLLVVSLSRFLRDSFVLLQLTL